MFKVFRTTGILSLVIWAAFFIIGLTQGRPFICIVSGLFFIMGFSRRIKIIKRKEPADVLWEAYVKENPDMKGCPYQFWQFISNGDEAMFDKLKSGVIKAQSFSVDFFEANSKPLPSLGQINILCCDDKVIGVCRTVDIIQVKFGQVDNNLAMLEGFSTLSKWKTAKKDIFSILCENMGMEFSDDMDLLFERFEIIFSIEDV